MSEKIEINLEKEEVGKLARIFEKDGLVRVTTERLLIRPGVESDYEDYMELVQDPETTAWGFMGKLGPQTDEEAHNHFKMYLSTEQGSYAIVENRTGKVIGDMNILKNDWTGTYEIGYVVNHHFWNKGVATEATKVVLKYLFEELETPYVSAVVVEGNVKSGYILKKCGFTFEGITRNSYKMGDILKNDEHYGITREEYFANKIALGKE